MLQDGEIDHRQLAGDHPDSLDLNVKKDNTVGEMANIDTFVITECNVAQAALWDLYESGQFECRLSAAGPPPPLECSICTSTVRNF